MKDAPPIQLTRSGLLYFVIDGIFSKWPNFKTCSECGSRMRHMARRVDYTPPRGEKIPMLADEADYRCESDDCGILWCEDGACTD